MHRMISTVFKILALSMLFMFLLDTSLLMVEIISIHSRVSNITSTMQNEVARNNCMPTMLVDTFVTYLDDIENNSRIMDTTGSNGHQGSTGLKDIRTNLTQSVSVETSAGNTTYPALTPDNAGEYGDFVTLVVEVTMHPSFVYYNSNRSEENHSFLNRGNVLDYKLNYIYNVPCLRYLK